jgi:hypothetical protein
MAGPLDEIDSRLDWTWNHIQELQDNVRRALEDGPLYDVAVEPQTDGVTYIYRAKVLRPIPVADLSHLTGDCIHNLRATLDNIVFGLVGTYRKPSWGTSFPLCRNPTQFATVALPKLSGIEQGAIDIIEALQPYKAGNRKKDYWLKVLNARWNRDKHRSPTVVGAIPSRGSFLAAEGVADFEIFTGRGLQEGVPMARVVYRTREHTHIHPQFAYEIGIEEGSTGLVHSIPGVLIAHHRLVRDKVLGSLRPFFK